MLNPWVYAIKTIYFSNERCSFIAPLLYTRDTQTLLLSQMFCYSKDAFREIVCLHESIAPLLFLFLLKSEILAFCCYVKQLFNRFRQIYIWEKVHVSYSLKSFLFYCANFSRDIVNIQPGFAHVSYSDNLFRCV